MTPQHHRVGAHRARRNPVAVTATAVGAVVALSALLIWGLLATDIIGGSSDTSALDAGGAATNGAVVEGSAPGASVTAAVPPVEASVTATPPTSSVPPPSSSAPPPPVVDQAATVTVLNGGVTVQGVARGTAATLKAAGWSGVDEAATTNAPGFPDVPATVVAYADPALQPTAAALAAALGAGTATQTTDYATAGIVTDLVVVLGQDFPVPPA